MGAAGTVTGSKTLVTAGASNLLVDCGLFQGLKELRLRNWSPPPFEPSKIDAVILTHAHIDHTGYLPLLVKNGFKGRIHATSATRDLCQLLLPDSARLQEEEAEYANRKGFSKHHPAKPLYAEKDALLALRLFRAHSYNEEFEPAPGFKCRFVRSGHLLGSAFVHLTDGQQSVLFSGDVGRTTDLLLRPPETPAIADTLVLESTYGDRIHSQSDPLEQVEQAVKRVTSRGGVVVVPAFAVGRAQEFLYCLYLLKKQHRIPQDLPVYLNSPMAVDATAIFQAHPEDHRLSAEECEALCRSVRYVNSVEESKALNLREGPMVIVSASGMATGGRVLHHLKAFGPDARNMILFAGYQAAGTRGASLLQGATQLKMHGQMVPIQAEVAQIEGLSGHADQAELIDWVRNLKQPPRRIFINHGEAAAREALGEKIRSTLGLRCETPNHLDRFTLSL